MIQFILELFTSAEKAEMMLTSPIIRFIFMALFFLFIISIVIHIALFMTFRKTRNYVKETGRMDIAPLHTFKTDFNKRQTKESVKVETFVQEKFSSWRLFGLPVVNLIKLVQMTVSVFILLGVLGTFIGLTISLGSISGSDDQLVENVAGVLSGIDVAFYTSIAGMGFSLIMTVLLKVFNAEFMLTDLMLQVESHLEGQEQQGMSRMIQVSEAIHHSVEEIGDSFIGFKDYTAGLEQSAKDLALFNEGLSENLTQFQELFSQMKSVTDGFSEGTDTLNKNFQSLFRYFKTSDQRNERLASSFEKSAKKIQDVSEAQLDHFQVYGDSVEELKDFTSTLVENQNEANQVLEKINTESGNLVMTMKEHNQTFEKLFGSELSVELSGIKDYLQDLTKGFDLVGKSIGSLPDALEVINKTQQQHRTLLSDRFEELKEFNRTFNTHLSNHLSYSENIRSTMKEASSSFEQIALKNNQLINGINQTVTQVNQHVNQRDQQLETNVDMLKDTLANYVANLEGTLGQKLDTVNRSINESISSLSDGLNRDVADMRRESQDIQSNHARATQQLLQDLGREIAALNRQLENFSQQTQSVQRIGMDRNEF